MSQWNWNEMLSPFSLFGGNSLVIKECVFSERCIFVMYAAPTNTLHTACIYACVYVCTFSIILDSVERRPYS